MKPLTHDVKQKIIDAICTNDRARVALQNCTIWPINYSDGFVLDVDTDTAHFDELMAVLPSLEPIRLEIDRIVVSREDEVEWVFWTADRQIKAPD